MASSAETLFLDSYCGNTSGSKPELQPEFLLGRSWGTHSEESQEKLNGFAVQPTGDKAKGKR